MTPQNLTHNYSYGSLYTSSKIKKWLNESFIQKFDL